MAKQSMETPRECIIFYKIKQRIIKQNQNLLISVISTISDDDQIVLG